MKEIVLPIIGRIGNAAGLTLSHMIRQLGATQTPPPAAELRAQGLSMHLKHRSVTLFCDSSARNAHRAHAIHMVKLAVGRELGVDLFSAERYMLRVLQPVAVAGREAIAPLKVINWQQLTRLGQMVDCLHHMDAPNVQAMSKVDEVTCMAQRGLPHEHAKSLAKELPLAVLKEINLGLQQCDAPRIRAAMASFPDNGQKEALLAALLLCVGNPLVEAGLASA